MLNSQQRQSLAALLPRGQVFTDRTSLLTYEVDAGLDRGLPDGVVFPSTTEDVARIVQWAAKHGVPLIGRGAGTGLSGGAVAERGGLIVEFSHMTRVREVDVQGREAIAEPGLINLHLDERVKTNDLYFPPDPASQRASTIGGNVAENSGGPHCFKYGVTTNYVIGMEVVLADGRIARVGGPAFDYPEYDLCGLITGSEGMLALMTAITIRLVRNPPGVKTMLAVFDSVEQAGSAVSAVIAAGLVPATMEMMDQKIIRIVEAYVHGGLPVNAEAILIVEVDGYPVSLDAQIEEIAAILQAQGGYDLRIARNDEERNQIWFARKSAAGAVARLAPAQYTVDVTVPRSRLTETLIEVNAVCERHQLRVGYVFHAGDGNLHPLILIPEPQNKELMQRVHAAGRETVEIAVRKGGSLSGEHGVGIEKRAFMPLMFNDAEMSAMLDIKHAFDPRNLFNPGKIFPAPSAAPSSNGQTIDQPVPGKHFAPANAQDAAQGMLALAREGRRVRIRESTDVENIKGETTGEAATGNAANPRATARVAPTINEYGRGDPRGRPGSAPSETILTTTNLHGIISYAPDDLYITVGSGTPLAEIQSYLGNEKKFVPLASPWQERTIGALVAANENAPLRMRYGAIRDLVLCATVALADGRVIRVGRPVIKNVAGFDVVKVFTGSRGTLGLLTEITLKTAAQPRLRRTLCVPVSDLRHGLIWARQLYPRSLVASAILLCRLSAIPGVPDSRYALVYTAEGIAEDVEAELTLVREYLEQAGAPEPIEQDTISGTDIWADTLSQARASIHTRTGLPVRDLPVYIQDSAPILNEHTFIADFGSGFLYTAIPANENARTTIEQLRQPALALQGYCIITHQPEIWQEDIDRWGYTPDALDVMRRLKERWDPQGILPGLVQNNAEMVV